MNSNKAKYKHFASLLMAMTLKDIKARYKHAILGFLWVFITPLLQMFVIATLFTFIIKTPIKSYYLFLFSGLLLWNFFSVSLSKAASSIIDQRTLIQKAKFPREIIPASVILGNFFHYLVSTFLLAIWILMFNKITVVGLILILPTALWLFILTYGISLIVAAYNVKYRDISYFLQIILQLLFYATPVIYPLYFIPQQLQFLYIFNPLTAPVQLSQFIFGGGNLPEIPIILGNIVVAGVFMAVGLNEFNRLSKSFDDWV